MSVFAFDAATEVLVGAAWALVLAGGAVWASVTQRYKRQI